MTDLVHGLCTYCDVPAIYQVTTCGSTRTEHACRRHVARALDLALDGTDPDDEYWWVPVAFLDVARAARERP